VKIGQGLILSGALAGDINLKALGDEPVTLLPNRRVHLSFHSVTIQPTNAFPNQGLTLYPVWGWACFVRVRFSVL
jgi:hypothetical protein